MKRKLLRAGLPSAPAWASNTPSQPVCSCRSPWSPCKENKWVVATQVPSALNLIYGIHIWPWLLISLTQHHEAGHCCCPHFKGEGSGTERGKQSHTAAARWDSNLGRVTPELAFSLTTSILVHFNLSSASSVFLSHCFLLCCQLLDGDSLDVDCLAYLHNLLRPGFESDWDCVLLPVPSCWMTLGTGLMSLGLDE